MLICDDTFAALRRLESNSVDVGVTSPPYNKQENKKGWLVKNVQYDTASDKKTETHYQAEQVAVLNELYRIIKPGGSFFYNHKIRWEKGILLHPIMWLSQTDWTVRQEIIWDRNIAANIRGWRFWQVEERIYWLYKPIDNKQIGTELLSRHAKMTSIWHFMPEGKNPHPAPFPLVLPTRAIYAVLDNQQDCIVIDPYAGSGTTLVAAKLLGHRSIGIDVSQDYIEMATERLVYAEQERDIVEQEKNKHQVKDTFADKKKHKRHVGRFAPDKHNVQPKLL